MISYIQTHLGSTFWHFLRDFVHPNSLWIYVLPLPPQSCTSKPLLDLCFSRSSAVLYIQTHFGSTFGHFLRDFIHPNSLWIYILPLPTQFCTSKPLSDLRFCSSSAISYTQTHFGSTFLQILSGFVHPNSLWIYVVPLSPLFCTSKPLLDLRFNTSSAVS